jgi:hypothetical protein
LIYRVLERAMFKCSRCDCDDAELTVRKKVENGVAVLSNLVSTCYACA